MAQWGCQASTRWPRVKVWCGHLRDLIGSLIRHLSTGINRRPASLSITYSLGETSRFLPGTRGSPLGLCQSHVRVSPVASAPMSEKQLETVSRTTRRHPRNTDTMLFYIQRPIPSARSSSASPTRNGHPGGHQPADRFSEGRLFRGPLR